MARFRRVRRRRLRFRPLRRRFYRRRRTRSRRSYRRRTNTRSSSRTFFAFSQPIVAFARDSTEKPYAYYPIGLRLGLLPGFNEYAYTYSKVRVLSVSVTIVDTHRGIQEIAGSYAICPSFGFLESQLRTADQDTPQPTTVTYGLYDTASGTAGAANSPGCALGHSINGGTPQIDRTAKPDLLVGVSLQRMVNEQTVGGTVSSTLVTNTGFTDSVAKNSFGNDLVRAGATVQGLLGDSSITRTIAINDEKPAAGGAFSLPPATLPMLQQIKRFRVITPPTTSRRLKIHPRFYTFMTSNGPALQSELVQLPRYFSSRRWMPMSWFSTDNERDLVLYGPYIVPLWDTWESTSTTDITVKIQLKVRLQFAGQV